MDDTVCENADTPIRIVRGGLDAHGLAALVLVLRYWAARTSDPDACVAPTPGALPFRAAWQGPAPHDGVWSRRAG